MSIRPRQTERQSAWHGPAPFRGLGHNLGRYTLYSERSGQIRTFTEAQLRQSFSYYSLAPRAWWCAHFRQSAKPGFDLERAAWAVIESCQKAGVLDEGRYRGRGCWPTTDNGVAVHLGDRLLAPGADKYSCSEGFQDGVWIYPRLGRVPGPAMENPMSLEETRALFSFLNDLAWEEDWAGTLAAGWMALAFFAGLFRRRPHIIVCGHDEGAMGALVELVELMLGGTSHKFYGHREADVRRALGRDALPFLYDVIESDVQGRRTTDQVLRLSTAPDSHSMMLMTTSEPASNLMLREARSARVAILGLQASGGLNARRRAALRQIFRFSQDDGLRLVARTLGWIRDGRFFDLVARCRQTVQQLLEFPWYADLYGTLLAGAWTLRTDEVPSEQELLESCEQIGIPVVGTDDPGEGHDVLDYLLRARVTGLILSSHREEETTIAHLVSILATRGPSVSSFTRKAAERLSYERGLRVLDGVLHIANTSPWVEDTVSETAFAGRWRKALRRLPGVRAGESTRFGHGVSRTTAIPLDLLTLPASAKSA